jgi:predicted regulator of Ras-like GTPase activity (Roadblock/LC7/MglB family)
MFESTGSINGAEPLTQLVDQIDHIMAHLLSKSGSVCVLLADVSGQLISAVGHTSQFEPGTVAALTAGDMSATAELARQLGEPKPFHILFHEGERHHLYLCGVGSSFILVVIFRSTVPIGLVRLFTERAVKELLRLTDQFEEALEQAGGAFSETFEDSLSDQLEDIFGSL